jgi:hypothetical protein
MLPHSLFRLTQRVYNTPHLITPQSFNVFSTTLIRAMRSVVWRFTMVDPILDNDEPDETCTPMASGF